MYYYIDEQLAQEAYELGHYTKYQQSSATEGYRTSVDAVVAIAQRQKEKVKPCYYEKIDRLTNRYAKKLANLINRENHIDAFYPSAFITGRSGRSKKKAEAQYNMRCNLAEGWKALEKIKDDIFNYSERKGVKV